ncbi:hypothetical protein B0H17DRAFT_1142996 [Mycena rosella]|uniref:Uncharacterized protein n=1 Tax=Mycena rosella TaxID=1033263 RepID=A0AAD7CW05_MYCRO|nr:hypothetical protein B0H17DRAFT_1142996 [Mycena rosella]
MEGADAEARLEANNTETTEAGLEADSTGCSHWMVGTEPRGGRRLGHKCLSGQVGGNTTHLMTAAQGTASFLATYDVYQPTPCTPCAVQFGATNSADKAQGASANNENTGGRTQNGVAQTGTQSGTGQGDIAAPRCLHI